MCGITGIWNLNNASVNKTVFDYFTDSLAHRGPDGRGVYIDPKCSLALGHRRLAILDLSPTGHQPMSYANGRYWITFNGEIYNFLELRDELEALGHCFRSDSDTEVILAAYTQWGEDCQFKFNGMWAFAIWDSKERILFLSRDRFGVKPLHYFFDGKRFAFASEMKAFLSLDWFQLSFDPQIVASALMNFNSIEGTEDCLLQDIKRLRGGHCLIIKQDQSPQIRRWWNTLEHLHTVPMKFEQQVEQFRELFLDAVKIRMRSDVPLGTALSGGLDSSSVLCAMAYNRSGDGEGKRLAKDWQRAFVATFQGAAEDERYYAEQVIAHTGAVPVYRNIDPYDAVIHLNKVLFQFEEIYAWSPVSPWMIYRELRKDGVVVSMDGHGGDELLGGYHMYVETMMQESLWPYPRFNKFNEFRDMLRAMYPEGANPEIPGFKTSFVKAIHRRFGSYMPLNYLYRMAKKASRGKTDQWLFCEPKAMSFPDFEEDMKKVRLDILNEQLYYSFHCTPLPTILRNFDRLSMAHGVEIRAPFMDWRVVCYGFSLPGSSKIGGGFTKRILREAMRGILPEPIRTRMSKIGFGSPQKDWFVGKDIRSFVLDSVDSRDFLNSTIWDGLAIKNFVHSAYTDSDFQKIWQVWKFIQAMHFMEMFSNKKMKRNELQN